MWTVLPSLKRTACRQILLASPPQRVVGRITAPKDDHRTPVNLSLNVTEKYDSYVIYNADHRNDVAPSDPLVRIRVLVAWEYLYHEGMGRPVRHVRLSTAS